MAKREVRFFNKTGPCNPDDHYMLPPEDRLVGAQLRRYIRDKLYWVLHAPRQTGKTTFLHSWMRQINKEGKAVACYVSVEACQGIESIEDGMMTICNAIQFYATAFDLPVPAADDSTGPLSDLSVMVSNWAKLVAPKPLILLFDEVDVLQGPPLISFLRLLRSGFASRGVGRFPESIALVGIHDAKDYVTDGKGDVEANWPPFNIKADSVILSNFSKEDMAKLFAQRTAETGQQITPEALEYAYELSQGQPWIVNSLFGRAVMRVLHEDNYETVTVEHLKEARAQMLEARETHLDALGVRLRDQRIKRVIQSIITGDTDPTLGRMDPDVELAIDLGLIGWDKENGFKIANPLYEELLTRYLNSGYHDSLPPPSSWKWQKPDGTLDMDSLLSEFQRFWRRHSDIWEQKADYTEAFPHLLLMAFLQRITNGEGYIDREYAAGRGRLDLSIEYRGQRFIIEIKLVHYYETSDEVREEGLEQIRAYRDKFTPAPPAYLLIFDRRPEAKQRPWSDRLSRTQEDDLTILTL
ncbi:MAG: PD-(D/E)XK nuclease domain-containing protein [Tannerellaceae bacterium]|jgi:hypothetical protein|nr:PD-(D/E)XK nuclease domain-containing protein [Tannerellaceae bacterium]